MRIISGQHRGRVIVPDRHFSARTTTDFAKEGLFNILANQLDFEGLRVLDLFSGTGGISYEFMSRGAAQVDAVELDARHAAFIQRSAALMHMRELRVVRHDVAHFIHICRSRYDIVFADPPFDLKWLSERPDMVLSAPVLAPGGLFVLEHPKSYDFCKHPAFEMHRNYGSVHFTIFKASGV